MEDRVFDPGKIMTLLTLTLRFLHKGTERDHSDKLFKISVVTENTGVTV